MTGAAWSMVQYRGGASSTVRAGLVVDGAVRSLPRGWPPTTLAMLDDWSTWAGRLRGLEPTALPMVADARLVAPVTYPRKVICAGANYYDHAAEMGTAPPDPADAPFFFLKPPTTTVIGPHADIAVDDAEGAQLDWEVELAVVVSTRCKNLDPADARAVVAGYAVANDISARGRFARASAVMAPFAWDWLAHKGLDHSCPLGPGIVPAWQVDDPQSLGLRLWVNGVLKQDSSTASMVVPVAELVAAASRSVTLEPGDVILTGTPAGVGMPHGDFLSVGDVVVAEIDGLGRLENTITSAATTMARARHTIARTR